MVPFVILGNNTFNSVTGLFVSKNGGTCMMLPAPNWIPSTVAPPLKDVRSKQKLTGARETTIPATFTYTVLPVALTNFATFVDDTDHVP